MGYYQKLHVSVVSTSIELKADLIFLGGGFPRFLKNEAKKGHRTKTRRVVSFSSDVIKPVIYM